MPLQLSGSQNLNPKPPKTKPHKTWRGPVFRVGGRQAQSAGAVQAGVRRWPGVRHYATPALRLTKPQPKATQDKASQNLEWPSFPGWRTPGLKGLPSFCLKGLQAPAEAETLRRRRSAHRGAWPLRAPPRPPPPRLGVSFAARVRPGGFFSGRPGSTSPVSPPGREAFEGRRPGASSLHCEVRRLFGR